MMLPTLKTDWAYFAGIIDGEGSIILSTEYGRTLSLIVSVGNTSSVLIEWLHTNFGGNVSKDKIRYVNHKQSWHWYVRGDEALNLLHKVKDFLKEKRPQAELGIEAWNNRNPTVGTNILNEHTRKVRYDYYLRMKELKGFAARKDLAHMDMKPATVHKIIVPCSVCGKEVLRKKSSIKPSGVVICSSACYHTFRSSVAKKVCAKRWHNP